MIGSRTETISKDSNITFESRDLAKTIHSLRILKISLLATNIADTE